MSNPNKSKSTITMAKQFEDLVREVDPDAASVEISDEVIDEPIKVAEDEFISIAGLASAGREKLLDALRAHAEKNKVVEYVPPQPTERQMTQTQLEMEAGRRAIQRHSAMDANRPQPKRDASEGFTTPVFRPASHVPNLNSGDLGARNVK